MKAIEVYVNGQYLLTAGIGEEGVFTESLTWVGTSSPRRVVSEFDFEVSGFDRTTGERVVWSVPKLGIGDEFTIKIIETDRITPESQRGVFNPPQSGESMEDAKKRLKAEGWYFEATE